MDRASNGGYHDCSQQHAKAGRQSLRNTALSFRAQIERKNPSGLALTFTCTKRCHKDALVCVDLD